MPTEIKTTDLKTKIWEAIRHQAAVTWENGPWVSTHHDIIHVTGLSHLPSCRAALSGAGVSYVNRGNYLEIVQ